MQHIFLIKIIAAIIILTELLSLICIQITVQSRLTTGNTCNSASGIPIRRKVTIVGNNGSIPRRSGHDKSAIKKPLERQGSIKRRRNVIYILRTEI